MGNLCGKESSTDPFSQPGRTLSSAPAQTTNKISALPTKVGGPPRTLGAQSTAGGDAAGSSAQEDARRKAAAAAEARSNAGSTKPKGKLATQLEEQKKQTRIDTLEALSKDERRARDADAAAEARAHN